MEQGLTVNKLPTDYREKLENAKIKERNEEKRKAIAAKRVRDE